MGVWTRRTRFAHSVIEPLLDTCVLQAHGTLLPILRDNDLLGGPFGRYVLAADARRGTCEGRRARGGAARQALERR